MAKRPVLDRIHVGDALDVLRKWPDEFVDCVVTSPPYWALRDYGVKGQLGLEASPKAYLEKLLAIFDELKRVLKPTGTLWVNLGDTYASNWGYAKSSKTQQYESHIRQLPTDPREQPSGSALDLLPPKKSLCLIPERFAIEMVRRGWLLRNHIVWHKPNHMPVSVKDRLACSWEHIFFFSKTKRYFFDLDSIRVPHTSRIRKRAAYKPTGQDRWTPCVDHRRMPPKHDDPNAFHPLGKNPGDCWLIPTRGYQGAHFAVFPERLCERPILAGCPPQACSRCGMPRFTPPPRPLVHPGNVKVQASQGEVPLLNPFPQEVKGSAGKDFTSNPRRGVVWKCLCRARLEPGVVLDLFTGSGTTAVVARRLGRSFLGIELNTGYARMARRRLQNMPHSRHE